MSANQLSTAIVGGLRELGLISRQVFRCARRTLRRWEHHREDASAAEARSDRDRAAMRLHDPLRNRKSQPEAAALRRARPRAIGAPETIEDVREIRRRNP